MRGLGFASRRFAGRFALGALMAGSAWPGSALSAEALPPLTPPKMNYAQLCRDRSVPLPLALDWRQWKDGESGIAPERMLADAMQLAVGGPAVDRDASLARRLMEEVAAGRSAAAPEARRQLALMLVDPRAGPTDAPRAARLLDEAVAAQLTDAATTLGRLILDGRLPGRAPAEAVRPLGIAAGLGEPAAALELAAAYASGRIAPPFEKAARHYATLASIGVQARLTAGDCSVAADVGRYLLSAGAVADEGLARQWFAIAAEGGDASATMRLARSYEDGDGVARDLAEATRLWDRAAAAGRIDAMTGAARVRLAAGRETENALAWLERGMANGDPDAFLLAARHRRGDYTGTADFMAMHAILTRAAARPDASAGTLAMLASSLLSGRGVAADPGGADELYRRVLSLGTAEADFLYGAYLARRGTDPAGAEAHLRRALDGGFGEARFALADFLACRADRVVESDGLLRDAAGRGDAAALRRLARQTAERGDAQEAKALLTRAVEAGDRPAMVELAAALFATEGNSTAVRRLAEAAAAPGLDMAEGRVALVRAYAAGRLGKDEGRSDRLLESLAASGVPDADVEIARRLLGGSGDAAARQDAVARLTRAAMAAEPEAMLLLARERQAAGDEAALDWLVRAAGAGEREALAELPEDAATVARVLAQLKSRPSCDMDVRLHEARLYRQQGDAASAEQVLAEAERLAERRPRDLYTLAQRLSAAPGGAQGDLARAEKLLLLSAEAGYPRAAMTLAGLYDGGRLGERKADAARFYRQAAVAGDANAVAALQRQASLPAGPGVQAALDALRSLAEAGVVPAMRAYGALAAGRGGEGRAAGIGFLRRAAGEGDVAAMKVLARIYATGIGGEVSPRESTRWTKMAAEKGDAEAMYRYAIALDLGFGVESDPQVAKSWHAKAVQNGFLQ